MQTLIPAQQAQQNQPRIERKSPESAQPQFEDARPEATAQLRLQSLMVNSARVAQLKSMQSMMAASTPEKNVGQSPSAIHLAPLQRMEDEEPLQVKADEPVQREQAEASATDPTPQDTPPAESPKPNNTGLPDQLKTGIENLSGISMDHVKVHYNSDKPAQLQAHAYAQGSEIHVAQGQEQHLPHEAWHVVQQVQGRVKPTMQLKGDVQVNDDEGLEREADLMGDQAALQGAGLQKKRTLEPMPESGLQGRMGNRALPGLIIQAKFWMLVDEEPNRYEWHPEDPTSDDSLVREIPAMRGPEGEDPSVLFDIYERFYDMEESPGGSGEQRESALARSSEAVVSENRQPGRLARIWGMVKSIPDLASQATHLGLDYLELGVARAAEWQAQLPYRFAGFVRNQLVTRGITLGNVSDDDILAGLKHVGDILFADKNTARIPNLRLVVGGNTVFMENLTFQGITWQFGADPIVLSAQIGQIAIGRITVVRPGGSPITLSVRIQNVQAIAFSDLPFRLAEGLIYGISNGPRALGDVALGRSSQPYSQALQGLGTGISTRIGAAISSVGGAIGQIDVFDLSQMPDGPVDPRDIGRRMGGVGLRVQGTQRGLDRGTRALPEFALGLDVGQVSAKSFGGDENMGIEMVDIQVDKGTGAVRARVRKDKHILDVNFQIRDYMILIDTIIVSAPKDRIVMAIANRFLNSFRIRASSSNQGMKVMDFSGRGATNLFTGKGLDNVQSAIQPGLVPQSGAPGLSRGAINIPALIWDALSKPSDGGEKPSDGGKKSSILIEKQDVPKQQGLHGVNIIDDYFGAGVAGGASGPQDAPKQQGLAGVKIIDDYFGASVAGPSSAAKGSAVASSSKPPPWTKERTIDEARRRGFTYNPISGLNHLCYVRAIVTALSRRGLIPGDMIEGVVDNIAGHLEFVGEHMRLAFIDAGGRAAEIVRRSLAAFLPAQGIAAPNIQIEIIQYDQARNSLARYVTNDGDVKITLLYTPGHFDLLT